MSSEEYTSDDEGGGGAESFALHDAVETGDSELLKQLLEARRDQLKAAFAAGDGGTDGEEGFAPMAEDGGADGDPDALARQAALQAAINTDPLLSLRDANECTPLHVAIIHGAVECARILVEAKARLTATCDGCPPLIMAVCTAAVAAQRGTALQLVHLLLGAGADVLQRDDMDRTALHWAAQIGLVDAIPPLLAAGAAATSQLRRQQEEDAAAVAAAAAEAGGAAPPELAELPPPPALADIPDVNGDLPLHLAARGDHADAVAALLVRGGDGWDGAEAAGALNKHKETPLHAAARHGAARAAAALLAAAPVAAAAANKHGFTAADLAERRGHAALAALLRSKGGCGGGGGTGAAPEGAAAAAVAAAGKRTLLVAPPECNEHYTAPQPVTRAGREPPPENTARLDVLLDAAGGALRAGEFDGRVEWAGRVTAAPMADLLRVHDWSYLRGLQASCASIPDTPADIGHVDADTAISHRTFLAARFAAGAVMEATDKVVRGECRNAFCAVRPPGHHAGPRGIVPSANDPNGSHGFCLVNNVAIGAAYALNVHRHAGIKRVAILDFDVHHGNGTEACVANTAPRTLRFPFSTPLSEGVSVHHTWHPWLGEDDGSNIFFASVQGYGAKVAGSGVYVYPGSGDTADTEELRRKRTAAKAAKAARERAAAQAMGDAGGKGGGANGAGAGAEATGAEGLNGAAAAQEDAAPADVKEPAPSASCDDGMFEEDPDAEFTSTSAAPPPLDGPRIIDVGITGPGFYPLKWRRAWRDKILPALVKFAPDIIFVSAGFDAHKKDEINFRYIGATEDDFEWLTDQIVQIANRCCGGRVVSVLEGGYNLRGGIVSAFARSVAAHVRALAEPHSQVFDAAEARAEREAERRRREDRAAKQAARAARTAATAAAAAAGDGAAPARHRHHRHHQRHDKSAARGDGAGGEAAAAAGEGAPAAIDTDTAGAESRPKRRRTGAVDYVALNAQLEEEAKAAGAKT